VITTSGTYPWSFVTQIPRNDKQSHGDDSKTHLVRTGCGNMLLLLFPNVVLSVILIENEANRAHCTEYMNTGIVLSYRNPIKSICCLSIGPFCFCLCIVSHSIYGF
jgi:hypothetical protein